MGLVVLTFGSKLNFLYLVFMKMGIWVIVGIRMKLNVIDLFSVLLKLLSSPDIGHCLKSSC